MPYNRAKHGAFLYPLCLRRRLSINSCGAWVREDGPWLPFSVAWPSIQPQTAPHWLPTWRKERCLGTLPGFQKQTPLFLALTRFSSSYFPFAAVSFFACAAPFPTMQEHFLPFCHQGRYAPRAPTQPEKAGLLNSGWFTHLKELFFCSATCNRTS